MTISFTAMATNAGLEICPLSNEFKGKIIRVMRRLLGIPADRFQKGGNPGWQWQRGGQDVEACCLQHQADPK